MDAASSPSAAQKGPKACTTCAKAKARCIPRADGGPKCERCLRLKKDCFSRPPAPPRIKKRPKRSRVAELEKRLNELSSQFEGQHHHSPSHPQQQHSPASTASLPATKPPSSKVADKGDILNFGHLFPSPSSTGVDGDEESAWSPEALKPWDSPWPLSGEAGVLLAQYHDAFAHLFPFVVVPKHASAADLRSSRPFLWKAIMMVSCIFDGARQAKLGEELLAEVGKAAVVDGIKSLDLLQGLELLVAWFHFALKSSQVTNLLFLARSMCVNLSSMSYGSEDEESKYGNLDHLRAYAGTYYLNTLVFTTNKRIDVFMNTTQLDTCCRVLENTMEFPTDEYLVKLVKVQQLAQTISLTMAFDPAMPAMSLPLTMVVESFQDQLDTFRATLPEGLADNPTLQCHLAIAEVLLMDIAISDQHCNSSNMPLTDRLQLLWSCVRSLRAFFKVRFAGSELERPRFLTLIASDIAYTFITGVKLLALRVPGWNLEHIGKELALDKMLGQQIHDLSEIIDKRKSGLLSTADKAGLEDPLERLVRLLRTAQELVALQLSGVTAQEIAQEIVSEMNSSMWQDLVNDSAGATAWAGAGDNAATLSAQ
ncbi:hypothetical protein JDV02_000834 [Purpureocillium takamizusanense]|uniref:Zn(2)-C6 fungal-type domain-containing protein n=1 Tax=Purpureocillium takamizusanense TaxID=2060973 RepID=A0A9Q8V6U4_9HYPO|nr:uncharacterized protein JDV02_000834 [Purpureocillium takamizusanense]UNI14177.1 hypothetical protein JDV02_000834 [Purpureocillium takamizusanense]